MFWHDTASRPAENRLFKAQEIRPDDRLDNSVGIEQNHEPPKELEVIAKECGAVVCSDLPCSVKSAEALGVKRIHVSDAIFREFECPMRNGHF